MVEYGLFVAEVGSEGLHERWMTVVTANAADEQMVDKHHHQKEGRDPRIYARQMAVL